MKLALLLWLAAALAGATLAAPRCNHFQLGLLFILFTAAPSAVYIWHKRFLIRPGGRREMPPLPEK